MKYKNEIALCYYHNYKLFFFFFAI